MPIAADDKRRLRRLRDGGHGLLKARIVLEERRGRLGPHDKIGMRRIRRADDFARGRAGLRNSGDVGLALLAGQVRELGDVAVPLPGPASRCPPPTSRLGWIRTAVAVGWRAWATATKTSGRT